MREKEGEWWKGRMGEKEGGWRKGIREDGGEGMVERGEGRKVDGRKRREGRSEIVLMGGKDVGDVLNW